jgi:hypothetical protein
MEILIGFVLLTPWSLVAIWLFGKAWTWIEPRIDRWMDRRL